MKKEIIQSLTENFESFAYKTEEGIEFWLARDLQHLLAYSEWRNFQKVITKAKTACELSGQNIQDHFVDVNKMVEIGSGVQKEISNEHIINNKTVRETLLSRGIIPENLLPEEDVKRIERKLNSDEKKTLKNWIEPFLFRQYCG